MQEVYYYFKSKWFELWEERKVRRRFYSDYRFCALDRAVLRGPNPYKLSKPFPYGETPLTVFHTLAGCINLGPSDHLFELGCGRGRGAFFLAYHFGCQVTAIDWEPTFIAYGTQVAQTYGMPVRFECQDFTRCDFAGATAVYLYGTCLDSASIERLSVSLQAVKHPIRVITVSYPLSPFRLVQQLELPLPWGVPEIFVQDNG